MLKNMFFLNASRKEKGMKRGTQYNICAPVRAHISEAVKAIFV
ncbi:hypothetical protein BACSTE_02886 [Bacteroides stercoris ATCC 43183]|uniref:Uncharacterized protein n=1 Tax=Bacteroides stercoris ATCC 43183 TaxID=449673 RepID=B0NTQ3_BACSE|nr:hypothetical protein BACSTE_02886 [Bacteroides stercoris ATCC 43183]